MKNYPFPIKEKEELLWYYSTAEGRKGETNKVYHRNWFDGT